jgi:adenylate cyclase class IV
VIELELKAVVVDPGGLRRRLCAAGAVPGFAGLLHDRRFDRAGELLARDEVLRTRRHRSGSEADLARASPRAADEGRDGDRVEVSWKGPVSVDRGYKRRAELGYQVVGGPVEAVLHALGYRVVEAVDRYVEYYRLGDASVRIEWYPRMDVLVEVEGEPAAIERAVAATGVPRERFSAEPLAGFVARYEAREGRRAATAVAQLEGEGPAWSER